MGIKKRFIFASLSTILITLFSITIIYSFVTYSSLSEIPSLSNIYRIFMSQRRLSEDEMESFDLLNTYVKKSPSLLEYPFNEEIIDVIDTIEDKGLYVAIRKNQDFTYHSQDLLRKSLIVHALDYDLNNFEPTGTLDNNGRFFHYVKNDFNYLDGSTGSFIILQRESNLFEFFVHWGFLVIILILFVSFVAYSLINRYLDKTVIKPLVSLEYKMRGILNDEGISPVEDINTAEGAVKEVANLHTSFKEMWEDLQQSQAKQVQYEENRKELITNISHDLKTPITSIIGYVEGLKDGVAQSDEKREQYLNTIYDKSLVLNELIDQLFLYSKLDLEGQFNFETINLYDYMTTKVSELKDDNLDVHFHSTSTTLPINADVMQLDRVLANIIQNSIKFKHDDRNLTLDIKLLTEDQHVQLIIHDNGIGINEEDLAQVFDRFYRADKSRTPTIQGSGLGLSIVKQIMEHHDGHIILDSDLNSGTTLTLIFPLRKDESHEA